MTLREMMAEMILFAFDDETLMRDYQLSPDDIANLSDEDLLDMYDETILREF